MLVAEYEQTDDTGRRRSARASVSLDAKVKQGCFARALCKIVDLSVHGARLQTYSLLPLGTTIKLIVPGMGQRTADVMWSDDFTAGCQFRKPLSEEVFAQVVAGGDLSGTRDD